MLDRDICYKSCRTVFEDWLLIGEALFQDSLMPDSQIYTSLAVPYQSAPFLAASTNPVSKYLDMKQASFSSSFLHCINAVATVPYATCSVTTTKKLVSLMIS